VTFTTPHNTTLSTRNASKEAKQHELEQDCGHDDMQDVVEERKAADSRRQVAAEEEEAQFFLMRQHSHIGSTTEHCDISIEHPKASHNAGFDFHCGGHVEWSDFAIKLPSPTQPTLLFVYVFAV
jgi:hypothetical protein